jgi:hypothetical protein
MPFEKLHISLLAILLAGLPLLSLGDKVDSLEARHDTVLVKYFLYNLDSLDMGKLYTEKTAHLSGFQRYDPLSKKGLFATLGNVGLAHKSLVYSPIIRDDFVFGIHSFDQYLFTHQNAGYYIHDRPVSYLSYFNGPKKEQLFRALLSHRIFKVVTVAADFSLINSPGTYFHQKSDNKSLLLTAQYITDDKRFGILANYTWNKLIVEENGGISNDSTFEFDIESDRALIDVNLETASNLIKDKGAYLNSYFYLSKSNARDTNRSKPKTFHAGRITYSFRYHNNSQLYTDEVPASEFYAPYDPIIDSNQTHDSLHIRKIENSFSWSNMRLGEDFQNKFLYINFAFKHQYVELTGYSNKRSFKQMIPSADIRIHPFSALTIGGHGHYTLGDYNNNGYLLKASGKLEVRLKNDIEGILDADVGFASQEPGYFYSFYQSNHFRWDTTFKKQNYRWFGAWLSVWKFKVGARYTSVSNLTYLDSGVRPAQYEGNIDILQLFWRQDFRWKVWNLDLEVTYQAASKEEAIHLPTLAGRGVLYATISLFKNAAVIQPGIDVFYNTAYYSDGYMPALKSFYWQDTKQTGNYYYMDVFLSLLVKRFRVFVKYEHLNSFWSKSRYYMAPHYPSQDAAFKWGLSWSFYD